MRQKIQSHVFKVDVLRELFRLKNRDFQQPVKQKVSDIRIQSVGLKALDFSSLNIYVEREKFCESTERYASSLGGLVLRILTSTGSAVNCRSLRRHWDI